MADAAIFYNNSITEVSGYAMFAEMRLGSNGDPWGEAEIATGTSPEDAEFSRITWDGDLQDGFDSDAIAQAFTGTLDPESETASGTSEVANEPLTFSTSMTGNIDRVQVRAMTLAAGIVSWSSIQISFYSQGVIVDSYVNSAGFSVDESNETGPVESEALLEVTTQHTAIDQVVISGDFRMTYDSTVITPGALDLAGQFFVYLA